MNMRITGGHGLRQLNGPCKYQCSASLPARHVSTPCLQPIRSISRPVVPHPVRYDYETCRESRTLSAQGRRSIRRRRSDPCKAVGGEVGLMLAAPETLPLYGRRVMVTAPRQYAQSLCQKLSAVGARPLWVPGVLISQLQDHQFDELDEALRNLDRFTHIAFTSKNGIYAVVQRLEHILGGADNGSFSRVREYLSSSSRPRLCALGNDGKVLTQLTGMGVDVDPAEASTQGLVKELVDRGEAAGAQVLCPVPLVTGGLVEPPVVPRFIQALTAAGATPTRVPAYLTSTALTPEDCLAEKALLAAGHVHAIAFSSTAEAQGLAYLMGGVDTIQAAVQQHEVCLAAHGPYTADGAGNVLQLHVHCVSANFKIFDGLVDALENHFRWYHHDHLE